MISLVSDEWDVRGVFAERAVGKGADDEARGVDARLPMPMSLCMETDEGGETSG